MFTAAIASSGGLLFGYDLVRCGYQCPHLQRSTSVKCLLSYFILHITCNMTARQSRRSLWASGTVGAYDAAVRAQTRMQGVTGGVEASPTFLALFFPGALGWGVGGAQSAGVGDRRPDCLLGSCCRVAWPPGRPSSAPDTRLNHPTTLRPLCSQMWLQASRHTSTAARTRSPVRAFAGRVPRPCGDLQPGSTAAAMCRLPRLLSLRPLTVAILPPVSPAPESSPVSPPHQPSVPAPFPCGRRLRVRQQHAVSVHLLPLPGGHVHVAAGLVRDAPPGPQGIHARGRPVVRAGRGAGWQGRFAGLQVAGRLQARLAVLSCLPALRHAILACCNRTPAHYGAGAGCACCCLSLPDHYSHPPHLCRPSLPLMPLLPSTPPAPWPPPLLPRYLVGGALSAGAHNLGMLVAGRILLGEWGRASRVSGVARARHRAARWGHRGSGRTAAAAT